MIDTTTISPLQHLISPSSTMHIGLVVPNLDRAMECYERLFGWKWTSTVRVRHELEGPCATQEELYIAFATGSPLVELIEDRPGSVWTAASGQFHHLGCWVTDLDEAGAVLMNAGFEFRARGRRAGTRRFAYAMFADPDGLLVEIQDARFEQGWRSWLDGAR